MSAYLKKSPVAEVVLAFPGTTDHATIRLFHRLIEVVVGTKTERHAMIPGDKEAIFFAEHVRGVYRRGYTVLVACTDNIPDEVRQAAHGVFCGAWFSGGK